MPELTTCSVKERVIQKIVTGMMILALVVVLSGCAEMSQTERSTLTGGAAGTAGGR